MATPAQIRASVDAKFDALKSAVQTKQTAYFATHGRYWQGLRTHALTPNDGAETLPDVGATSPTDQPDPWPSGIRGQALPMALVIDVYDGPFGHGYSATLDVTISGTTYRRIFNVGGETWRARAWTQVVDDARI